MAPPGVSRPERHDSGTRVDTDTGTKDQIFKFHVCVCAFVTLVVIYRIKRYFPCKINTFPRLDSNVTLLIPVIIKGRHICTIIIRLNEVNDGKLQGFPP